MALSASSRLGPYEILAPIGAGGMGEVYRARDTRLGRDVAVKVLPEHVAKNAEALARFEREAKTAAGLNDPHICSLHDVGTVDEVHYAVFELLEGETLRERLSHGALPPSKAVELATQICQGLAAAHAKGIVHRDLKPENLFLTRAGLKILDFGLAKLQPIGGVAGEEGFSREQTLSAQQQLTSPGTAPGTVAYMSPEQARGEAADARSDIFATGLVLFEMLSGERPFRGDTQAETLVAILKEDPPELSAPSGPVAPGLERIIRRCLEKDPEDRFQSARDVTFALEAVSGLSGASVQAAEAQRRMRSVRRWTIPALALGAVAVLVAGVLLERLWLRSAESSHAATIIRSQIDLTAERPLRSPWLQTPTRTELALNPEGTLLVWASGPDDPTASALYLRRLDTGEVTRIPGTEGAHQPFFSPDGLWIGFCAYESESKNWLRRVSVEGGLVADLAELPWWPKGASWAADGRILLGSPNRGIQWVSPEGGPPREITTADSTREVGHWLPSLLPGGHALLLTTMPNALGMKARVETISLPSEERKILIEDGADARYVPTGHLVFARQGVLMAAPFDLQRLELTASPVPVVEGVSQALGAGGVANSGAAQFAASDTGVLVYAAGDVHPVTPTELLLVDEAGRAEPLAGFDRPLVSPQVRYSPDGRQLAFVEQARSGLLWLFDVERHTYQPLSNEGLAGSPRWSPDGSQLVAAWSEGAWLHLWLVPTGRGEWERLTDGGRNDWAPSWSPDGRVLAFVRGSRPSEDIFLYRFEDRQVVPFLTAPARETHPEFSPDGRWLAYRSDESGQHEVYVTSFPDRERTFTVSRQGGTAPAWSRDGQKLYYYSLGSPDGSRRMMAVTVQPGPELSLGRPAPLFTLPEGFQTLYPMRAYELHPDGQRFLVGRRVETEPPPPITRLNLVHNWFAELERLAPTGR
jgi:serine/threonine protein kinase/Tol biopolymer transport system component